MEYRYLKNVLLCTIALLIVLSNINSVSAKEVGFKQEDINNVINTYLNQQYLSLKESKVEDFSAIVKDKYLLDTVTDTTKYKIDFNNKINKKVLDYKLDTSNIDTKLDGKRVIAHILSTANFTYQKDQLSPY